ncbi:MAG: hypothetical protein WC509_03750 [Candidatus Izemoplasmatales bacterium]
MRRLLLTSLLLILVSTLAGCPPLTTRSPYDGWLAEDVLVDRLNGLQDEFSDGYAAIVRREIRVTDAEAAVTAERRTFLAVFSDASSLPDELFIADGARDVGDSGEVALTRPNRWRTVDGVLAWQRHVDPVTYIGPAETSMDALMGEHGWNFLRFAVWDDFGEVTRKDDSDWEFEVEAGVGSILADPVFAAMEAEYAEELAHLDPAGSSGIAATFLFSTAGWSSQSACVGLTFTLTLDLDPAYDPARDEIVVTLEITCQLDGEETSYAERYRVFDEPFVASDPAFFPENQGVVVVNSWVFFDASLLGGGCFRSFLEAGAYGLTADEPNGDIPVSIVGADGTAIAMADARFAIAVEQAYDFCVTAYEDPWVVFLLVEADVAE